MSHISQFRTYMYVFALLFRVLPYSKTRLCSSSDSRWRSPSPPSQPLEGRRPRPKELGDLAMLYGSDSFERRSFQQMMDETLQVLGSFRFDDFSRCQCWCAGQTP
jgi:hypothetical protein